jgi:ATP-dependent Zn protease
MLEGIARAMINTIELVAGRVGERVFFPDREPLPAESDFIEATAFASVISSSLSSASALVSFAEAEAEALIRAHMGVVEAIADAMAEQGTLDGEQVDQIISDAVAAGMLAAERKRRREMQARAERAEKFKEVVITNG